MIKYLGSKRQILPYILEAAQEHAPHARSVLDIFSGTARVGHAFKQAGYQVFSNDHNLYAHTLAQCYVEADLEKIEKDAARIIQELNQLSGKSGYFTDSFCINAQFFHPKNGERIDAMREAVERKDLPPLLRSVVLISLMEAADRVDSTCGVQMAYLKQWARRAHDDIALRMPKVLPAVEAGECRAYCADAEKVASEVYADLTYLDPPYNQHSYRSNYHIWETLVLWDKPELYGKAQKRIDCRSHKSAFNSKTRFLEAFSNLVRAVRSPTMIVSFNNEGFISREDMESLLKSKGDVQVKTINYKRYVGAQIGIYNPKGEAVGKVSHLYNQEYLYIVDRK